MTIRKRSTPSSKNSPKPARRTPLGRRLEKSATEALAHARGQLTLDEYQVRVPETVDIAAIREELGMSQAKFAAAFGLDVAALRDWEQHRRRPDRAARALFVVIAHDPDAVRRALAVG